MESRRKKPGFRLRPEGEHGRVHRRKGRGRAQTHHNPFGKRNAHSFPGQRTHPVSGHIDARRAGDHLPQRTVSPGLPDKYGGRTPKPLLFHTDGRHQRRKRRNHAALPRQERLRRCLAQTPHLFHHARHLDEFAKRRQTLIHQAHRLQRRRPHTRMERRRPVVLLSERKERVVQRIQTQHRWKRGKAADAPCQTSGTLSYRSRQRHALLRLQRGNLYAERGTAAGKA